jgi:hypothetical protein
MHTKLITCTCTTHLAVISTQSELAHIGYHKEIANVAPIDPFPALHHNRPICTSIMRLTLISRYLSNLYYIVCKTLSWFGNLCLGALWGRYFYMGTQNGSKLEI